MNITPQLPLDFFSARTPSFDNFIVGQNGEAVSALRRAARGQAAASALTLWGGSAVGKSHLIAALGHPLPDGRPTASARAESERPLLLSAASRDWPEDPFVDALLLAVDDADQLPPERQGWLFTAFNHIAGRRGIIVTAGQRPPGQWPLRDDLRTRLASGLTFELTAIPQDDLAAAVRQHAIQRGLILSEDVLTYILTRSQRDMASLYQLVDGIDALSLALKRPLTVPLLRTYLATRGEAAVTRLEPGQ